jgi:hypothetical protein
MSPEPRTIRAGQLIGRVHRSGGRVADLLTETGPDGRERVVSAYVVGRPWGRLLGYERREVIGPRLLEFLARRILRRHAVEVPIADLDLDGP